MCVYKIEESAEKIRPIAENYKIDFISNVKREKFNYTEWRKDKFNDMTAEELNNAAAEYGRLHHKD